MEDEELKDLPDWRPRTRWWQYFIYSLVYNLIAGVLVHFLSNPITNIVAGFFFVCSFIAFWAGIFNAYHAIRNRKK